MSRFTRVPRRPDHWSSPHERARSRAAERIDSPLDPAEVAWLDAHLTDCADCRAVASAYDVDRIALRALRDVPTQPPRDLWARTSAGIEREARRHRRPTGQRSRVPLGALSGIAVVAIVVGATALSGGWLDQPAAPEAGSAETALGSPGASDTALSPGATPMVVDIGRVQWMASRDGRFVINDARPGEVCPTDDQPGCAALEDQAAKHIALSSSPRSITKSPRDDQAVVVSSDGSGGDQVFMMSLPAASDATRFSPEPTASAAPTESAEATETAETSEPTEPAETATTEPTASATDTTAPSDEPTATAERTAEPTPSDEPATPEPTPTPTPVVVDSPQPTATALAIASGVTVVGQSAAFSADGTWFAFTARPSDDSRGPDIYVWHTGEDAARKLTTDGMSTFGSWDGNQVVGSRPVIDDTSDGSAEAVSFVMDPTTGEASEATIALWRPVIDPTDRFAVAWDGTVVTDASLSEIATAEGELILTTWQADASTGATRSRIPGGSGDIADFDVRWDETGTWVAIWTAGPNEPTVGRLSLYRVDRDSGALESPKGAPTDVPALPGFSIGDGRLAWATPHGQDAEGSKVQVVAWSGSGVGAVESVPGEDVIVVR